MTLSSQQQRVLAMCAANFVLNIFLARSYSTSGIVYLALRERFPLQAPSAISWVGAVKSTTAGMSGLLMGPLMHRFGQCPVALCGVLLIFMSDMTSAFVTQLPLMVFTYGFVAGLGYSTFQLIIAVSIQRHVLTGRIGLANGVIMSGQGIGIFVWPPLLEHWIVTYGWTGALWLDSAMMLHACVIVYIIWIVDKADPRTHHHKDASAASRDLAHRWDSLKDPTNLKYVKKECDSLKDPTNLEYDEMECESSNDTKSIEYVKKECDSSYDLTNMDLKHYKETNEISQPETFASLDSSKVVKTAQVIDYLTVNGTSDHLEPKNGDAVKTAIVKDTPKDAPTSKLLETDTRTSSKMADQATHVHPARQRKKAPHELIKDILLPLTVIRHYPQFLVYCLGLFLAHIGHLAVYFILPSRGVEIGCTPQEASFVVSVIGAINLVARIAFGAVSDVQVLAKRRVQLIACSFIVSGLSALMCAFLPYPWALVSYAVIFGLCTSFYIGQQNVLCVSLMSVHLMPIASGVLYVCLGVGWLLGYILSGMLLSMSEGSTWPVLLMVGGCMVLGGCITCWIPCCPHSRKQPIIVQTDVTT